MVKIRDVVRPMAMFWGVSLPWNLLVSVALGLWLMFAPAVFGSTGAAAYSDHLVGALTDVGRAVRFVNIVFAAWVIVAPWILGGATPESRWRNIIIGALVILLSFPLGKIGERYGSWQRYIR